MIADRFKGHMKFNKKAIAVILISILLIAGIVSVASDILPSQSHVAYNTSANAQSQNLILNQSIDANSTSPINATQTAFVSGTFVSSSLTDRVWYNPFTWGKAIQNYTYKDFEKMFLDVFGSLLNDLLSIFSSIFGIIMSIIQDSLSGLVDFSISMGPFGLPVFTIGTLTIIGAFYTMFHILHDTPIVGDLV